MAQLQGLKTPYNLQVYGQVFTEADYTYFAISCMQNEFLKAFHRLEEYSVSESEYEDPNNSKTKLWKSLMEKTATPMTINFGNGIPQIANEAVHILKAIAFPIAVFCLGLFTINMFGEFGKKLICPLSGAMWDVGVLVALLMPSQRKDALNHMLIVCATYYGTLITVHAVLSVVSGVSSEMIAASFEQAIPTSTGNAIPGYLQTMMWFTGVLVPLGEIGYQLKRLFQFKKQQTLAKTFAQKRGLRNGGRSNSNIL